jgi:hypothetical protein
MSKIRGKSTAVRNEKSVLRGAASEIYSLHIRARACAAFGNEAVDPRGDNRQRNRAELEHGVVERADVEY